MDDLFSFFIVILIIVFIGAGVKSCYTPPSTPQTQTAPTGPSTVKPPANKKISPPIEISTNVYQFDSSSWPESLASWIEANPKKRIVGKPVFQPSWDGSDIGTYLVITEDAPKAEPKLEQ